MKIILNENEIKNIIADFLYEKYNLITQTKEMCFIEDYTEDKLEIEIILFPEKKQ